MIQPGQPAFLDSDILFLAAENPSVKTIINHSANHDRFRIGRNALKSDG
ncbi:hypothetical protein ASZ90_011178 [hydrocarbon metagenome]|uniref:Uncharacterized protein n=1 Tax=hydrocarbon metagenome TaxID=938273 RepID=A0A0W8FDZ2_9ZZZZ